MRNWAKALVVIGPVIALFSSMPAYGLIDVAMGLAGLYESHDLYADPRLGPFTEYAPHWIVSTGSLLIWIAAYTVYFRSLRVQTSDSAILCTIVVWALALMGKFLDLLYEGRLFTGSYWTVLMGIVLVASTFPKKRDDVWRNRTLLLVAASLICILITVLNMVVVQIDFSGRGDALRALGATSIIGLAILCSAFIVVPRTSSRVKKASQEL